MSSEKRRTIANRQMNAAVPAGGPGTAPDPSGRPRRRARSGDKRGKSLEEGGELFEGVFRTIPFALSISEPATGILLHVNRACEDLTGFTAKELVGSRAVDLSIWADPEDHDRYVGALKSRRGIERFETRLRKKDGTIRDVVLSASTIEVGGESRLLTAVHDLTNRKRMEEALKESEERYRRITSAITDYIYTVFLEGGDVVRTVHSPACEAVTGYAPEDFERDPFLWYSMIEEEDREFVREHFSRVTSGERVHPIEHRIRRKDGALRWVSNMPVVHRDAQGVMISYDGVISDITERKRAEEAVRESERRYRGLATNLPGVVYQFYVRSDGSMGMYYVGDRAEEILGLHSDPEDFIERGLACVPPEYREYILRSSLEAAQKGSRWDIESPFTRPDGRELYLRGMSQPEQRDGEIVFNGVLLDVTDIRKAEKALKESEESYRLMAELTGKMVYDYDVASGRMTWHGALFRLTGFLPGEFSAADVKVWNTMIHPEDRSRTIMTLEEALKECGPYQAEYRIRKKDGSYIYVEDHGVFLPDASGNAYRMLGSIGDITERKKAEEVRLEMERRLLHAQRLESLGVMAGGIAHDFNNLLMAILGNLDLARIDLSPVSRSRPFIDQALVAVRRAADLTNQMLAYSGKGRVDLKIFDLSELLAEMSHLFRASISKTVTLNLQPAKGLHSIKADPGQIQQVIMNLIVNASEAIGDTPGVVTISTGSTGCTEDDLMQSRLKEKPQPGEYVFLEVSDTGCGMDEETMDRLFDPFFTTKFTGRGLGLAAVSGIMNGHRGAITVDSKPGTGTTIRVLLPVSTEQCQGAVRTGARAGRKVAGEGKEELPRGTVLVVDDEEMVRNLCRSMVERLGFNVVTASDGDEAVRVFQERGPGIVCVILDLTMPNKDGMETFDELKRMDGKVRVILSSGFNEQDVTRRFLGKGLAGFIKKPYQMEHLGKELQRVLGGR